MVQTAIFRVAHTIEIDPDSDVFLYILSDNGLKTVFGRVCMIGSHTPNFDISQINMHMSLAIQLDYIFQDNSDWEK